MSSEATTSKKETSDKKKEAVKKEELRREIILWVTIAISFILFISNFGVGGRVGGAVSSLLFGLFGLIAYIFPIMLLVGCFFGFSNRWKETAVVKIVFSILFAVGLCLLFNLLLYEKDVVSPIQAYKDCSNSKNGGGMLGALFTYILVPAFGIIGAYIIDFILLIICVIVITEKSAIKPMKRQGKKVYTTAREKSSEILNNDNNRSSKKHIGVSLNTKILPKSKKNSDEMGEIKVDSYPESPEVKEEIKTKLNTDGAISYNGAFNPAEAKAVTDTDGSQEDDGQALNSKKKRKVKLSEEENNKEIENVKADIEQISQESQKKEYYFPKPDLLTKGSNGLGITKEQANQVAEKLMNTLQVFGVDATVKEISFGPAVTRYELQPELGVKVSKIVGLSDDIKLALAAADIRIEAPIPGKSLVGIEIPNSQNVTVAFRDLVESDAYKNFKNGICFAVGKDISGNALVSDIAKMPHLLIAGATGSGKSVCINTIIMSILYKYHPDDVKLMMIDPKVVELSVYNGIPHLLVPVVTDPKRASGALQWAVKEMTDRYEKFATAGVREITGYNQKVSDNDAELFEKIPDAKKLPKIVIIVDELADLMMVASKEVEESICRLAQLARAAGIHLIIATQRPSVNVITGLIKANMPSRIAFAVTSNVDSRTILDMSGAEKLLGKGDMLFDPQGAPKPQRVQGAFISDNEVQKVVDFIKSNNEPQTSDEVISQEIDNIQASNNQTITISEAESNDDGRDSYFEEAARIIVDKEKASIGMLQRYLKIGFNRAARIMDQLEEAGVVGPELGTKPRTVLMNEEQFQAFIDENQEK